MRKGKLITLEGIEGVGKTTNLVFIKKLLEDSGLVVFNTREPGGTIVAEKIRMLLLEDNKETLSEQTELLLMFAARSQHINRVILPMLSQGNYVLCDRFIDSTYAYQYGGRNMDIEMIEWLDKKILGSLRPDLTLVLDVPIDISLERVNKRDKIDRFESEDNSFFNRVREVYLDRVKSNPERMKLIDATQSEVKVKEVIKFEIENFLQK